MLAAGSCSGGAPAESKAENNDNGANDEKTGISITSDSLYVKKVEGLSDDFALGCDISSVIALEESGVKFYGWDGEEHDLFRYAETVRRQLHSRAHLERPVRCRRKRISEKSFRVT